MKSSAIEFEGVAAACKSPLRRDLRSVTVQRKSRLDRIIIDEISGRFARVSDHVWQRLQRGDADDRLWYEARSAGWTRHRDYRGPRRFNPLALRVPFGSIDWIASKIARWSNVVFSTSAVVGWIAMITCTFLLVVFRADEILGSLGSLEQFLAQSRPLLTMAVFVTTKLLHELAHAVMCRRIGSRCGSFGILLLCGVPCPYCDVTDIWRHSSAAKRIAVMLAGIYVELILAALAAVVWLSVFDPAVRLAALNVMIVCGVSTIVFNANPLMRYDGYYVLADLIGSTDLRREGRESFSAFVISRLGGKGYGIACRSDARTVGLAIYHVAAMIYRVIVLLAIAALILGVSHRIGIGPIAKLAMVFVVLMMLKNYGKRILFLLRGVGPWEHVPRIRRGFVVSIVLAFTIALLFTPLPRFRRAYGVIDAALASNVYTSSGGMVESVFAEFGDRVEPGQTLLHLKNEALTIEEAVLNGQWQVAKLRSDLSRKMTVSGTRRNESERGRFESAVQWPTLRAAEEAVAARLASSRKRIAETKVNASVGGVVIPIESIRSQQSPGNFGSLRERVGRTVDLHLPWCRISADGQLHAALVVDARDREQIEIGSPVNLCLAVAPDKVFASTVASVSEIHRKDPLIAREAEFRVLCSLPLHAGDRLLQYLGSDCEGVFPLPKQTLFEQLSKTVVGWLTG